MHESFLSRALAQAVQVVAQIHHSHGTKAMVALTRLTSEFPHWPESVWQAALTRARWFNEPRTSAMVIAPAIAMTEHRARTLLSRSVVPAAYTAVREWAKLAGTEAVIRHYLDEACSDPGYLGHRLSVLLGFLEAWPLYRGGPYELLFFDRLTEFLLTGHFAPSSVSTERARCSIDEAVRGAVRRPGFFGHHLICLAWICRNSAFLSESQLGNALTWVVKASATVYADEEDNVIIEVNDGLAPSREALEDSLRDLMTLGVPNIHLLTLADAIATLWPRGDERVQKHLLAIASHFTREDAA